MSWSTELTGEDKEAQGMSGHGLGVWNTYTLRIRYESATSGREWLLFGAVLRAASRSWHAFSCNNL